MTRSHLDDLSDDEIEYLHRAGLISDDDVLCIAQKRLSPRDLAILDAVAYGIAKLFNTPINQLTAEAAAYGKRVGTFVGSKVGTWALQAFDYAYNTDSPYVATAYMKPPPQHIYDVRSRWVVYVMQTRQALDDWYGSLVGSPDRYHYLAVFDKTSPEWAQSRPVSVSTGDPDAHVGAQHPPRPVNFFGAGSHARDKGARHMSEHAGFNPYAGADYVGADGSYPEIAARAVAGVYQQTPSPIYGYLRAGMQQKIYLFGTLDQGSGWFTTIVHGQSQPYDYAAVFAATDLSQPVPGLESFGHTAVSGDTSVGSVLPFLLGLPLGGLAGYFLRRWQEQNPGHTLPLVPPGKLPAPIIPPAARASGDYIGGPWLDVASVGGPWLDVASVGGPWLDIVSASGADQGAGAEVSHEDIDALAQGLSRLFGMPPEQVSAELLEIAHDMNVNVGGPWLDLVSAYDNPWLAAQASPSHARVADWMGASYGVERHLERHPAYSEAGRMHAWPQTRALIESAKREIADNNASYPAAAWVWALDPSGPSSVPGVELTGGTSSATPFSSHDQALDYMRSRIQTPHVALALFDVTSPHWPNPVNWTKSDDPSYESIIAQRLGQAPQMSGSYIGEAVGSDASALRLQASQAARMSQRGQASSPYLGVVVSDEGNSTYKTFSSLDVASDWLATGAPLPNVKTYLYAAIYDATDPTWPSPISELLGDPRMSKKIGAWGTTVGSAIDGVRERAQALAQRRAGSVVGVIHTSKDDLWHTLAFRTEDDADDWLDTATHSPSSYTYAAYFNKEDARFWPQAVIEKISGMRAPPGTEIRRRTTTSGRWAA